MGCFQPDISASLINLFPTNHHLKNSSVISVPWSVSHAWFLVHTYFRYWDLKSWSMNEDSPRCNLFRAKVFVDSVLNASSNFFFESKDRWDIQILWRTVSSCIHSISLNDSKERNKIWNHSIYILIKGNLTEEPAEKVKT